MAIEGTAPVLVLGVDGSPDSQAAIRWAQRYAEATNATVHVVVAWSWPQSYGYPVMLDGYDPRGDAQRVVEKAIAKMSLPADRLKGETREGSPGPALWTLARVLTFSSSAPAGTARFPACSSGPSAPTASTTQRFP